MRIVLLQTAGCSPGRGERQVSAEQRSVRDRDDGSETGPALSPAQADRLLARLRAAVDPTAVITHPHALTTYESDALLQYHARPRAAVLPARAEEVQAVVRACGEAGVPWVARGSGSGLSGGAVPVEGGSLSA